MQDSLSINAELEVPHLPSSEWDPDNSEANEYANELELLLLPMGFRQEDVIQVIRAGITDVHTALMYLFEEAQNNLEDLNYTSCPICETPFEDCEVIQYECYHRFCANCYRQYLELKISEGEVLSIECPMNECRTELQADFVISTVSEEYKKKFLKFKRTNELGANQNLRWCPKPDCEGFDIGRIKKQKLECNECGFEYCYYCLNAWHGKSKCKEQNDLKLDKWSRGKGVKFCPNCKSRVEKLEGCDHMTCVKCAYEWCWLCGEKYYSGHFQNCRVKNTLKKNPPLLVVMLCFFAPILYPLGFVIGSLILLEAMIRDAVGSLAFRRALMKRHLSYPVFIVTSLVLTPICFVAGPFVFSFMMLAELVGDWDSEGARLFAIIGGGIILAPLTLVGSVLAAVVAHFVGIYFLGVKVCVCIRRCWDPEYLSPQNYARY